MKRVPKIGDTVLIVSRRTRVSGNPLTTPATVTKIGRSYFYCKNGTGGAHVFDVESYVDGAWCDKTSSHDEDAYISREIYDKMRLKQARIDEIQRADLDNCSCAKVSSIYTELFASPDKKGAEEWEGTP
jgi:hypothetical protein